jgi:ApbE superfamily uncharacterized protein (UPF0280 family)
MAFSHGPINLVLEVFGAQEAVRDAEDAATRRFVMILHELCDERNILRQPVHPGDSAPQGPTARRMYEAVRPFASGNFITPMAAVAGAVADEILAHLVAAAQIEKAYVNNGGDIALHLSETADFIIGIVDRVESPRIAGTTRITANGGVRGVATSGWGGRSFSLGIADAVTVLAKNAAAADAAATIIANAVDLPGHPAISRCPAAELWPDSDLGNIHVTTGVGTLARHDLAEALQNGLGKAQDLADAGRISGAALFLQGRSAATRNLGLANVSHAVDRHFQQVTCHA